MIYSTYIPSDSRSSVEEFPMSELLIRIEEDLGGNEASTSALKWEVNYQNWCIVLEHGDERVERTSKVGCWSDTCLTM